MEPFKCETFEELKNEAIRRVQTYIAEHKDEHYEYFFFDFEVIDGKYYFGGAINTINQKGSFIIKNGGGEPRENEGTELLLRLARGEDVKIKPMTKRHYIWSSYQYFNPYFPASANRNGFAVLPNFDF